MCKTGFVGTVNRLGSTSELVRSAKPLLAQLIKIQANEIGAIQAIKENRKG